MKKQDVYVSTDTPEKCKALFAVLEKHNEPIYFHSLNLKEGALEGGNFVDFDDEEWIRGTIGWLEEKTEISVEELDQILSSQYE